LIIVGNIQGDLVLKGVLLLVLVKAAGRCLRIVHLGAVCYAGDWMFLVAYLQDKRGKWCVINYYNKCQEGLADRHTPD
jgi:hypothetical protein